MKWEWEEADHLKAKVMHDFRQWNDDSLKQKELVKRFQWESKLSDNEEFFPYTHGDLIEE